LVCSEPRTWTAAREGCLAWGGGLAIVGDAAENDFLTANLAGASRWIGANDRGVSGVFGCGRGGDEGAWYWASANMPAEREAPLCSSLNGGGGGVCSAIGGAYQNWRSGQPDNASCQCSFAGCSDGEDCATLLVEDGRWNDRVCDQLLGYICESP
jgi:hypothetical protein